MEDLTFRCVHLWVVHQLLGALQATSAMINVEKESSLLQWVSVILEKEVSVKSLIDGNDFILLLERTNEKPVEQDRTSFSERFGKIIEELEAFYQTKMDDLISVKDIMETGNLTDFQTLSILLLILTYGLQSKNAALFKQSACNLSENHQQEIMHLTEELLQSDPSDGRPIEAGMLRCLMQKRDRILTRSMPAQPTKLCFDARGDGPVTPITYSNSPSTPLKEWLDSPQMVQKNKLRLKEQELRKVRKDLIEEENMRHESELELLKTKQEMEKATNELRHMEKRLSQYAETASKYKEQVVYFMSKQETWENSENEWNHLRTQLQEYKQRANEAGWWEKEYENASRERNSLRLKALALERNRGRRKDNLEMQMVELASRLREADDEIKKLFEEKGRMEAETQTLQRKNEELQHRLTSMTFDNSVQFGDCTLNNESICSVPGTGESMQVVTDLRIAELESQLTEIREKMVPVEELTAANSALKKLSQTTVAKGDFERELEVRQRLELDKVQLLESIETLESKLNALKKEKDMIIQQALVVQSENKKLIERISVVEKDLEETKLRLESLQSCFENSESKRSLLSADIDQKELVIERQQKELRIFLAKHEDAITNMGQLNEELSNAHLNLDRLRSESLKSETLWKEKEMLLKLEVENYRKRIESLTFEEQNQQRRLTDLEKELSDTIKERDVGIESGKRLTEANQTIDTLASELKVLKIEREEQEVKISGIKKRLNDASEDNRKLCEEIAVFHKGTEELAREHAHQMKVLQSEIHRVQKEKETKLNKLRSVIRTSYDKVVLEVEKLRIKDDGYGCVLSSIDVGLKVEDVDESEVWVDGADSICSVLNEVGIRLSKLGIDNEQLTRQAIDIESNYKLLMEEKEKLAELCNSMTKSEAAISKELLQSLEKKEESLKEVASLMAEIEKYKAEIEEINDKLLVSEMAAVESKAEYQSTNSQLLSKIEELREKENLLEDLRCETLSLKKSIVECQERESKLNEEIQALQEIKKVSDEILKSELSNLRANEASLTGAVELERLNNEKIKAENERVITELHDAKASLKNLPVIESIRDQLSNQLHETISRLQASEAERNRLQTEIDYALAKADNAELCRVEEARGCESLREVVQTLEVEIENHKLRLKDALVEANELKKNEEKNDNEIVYLKETLKNVEGEKNILASKAMAFQKEMECVQSLRNEVCRLESEVEHTSRALEASERQKVEISQVVENIWSERLAQVEEQNELLNGNLKQLECELANARRSLREVNVKHEEELRTSIQKLENRERAFAEERSTLVRMRDEAREMAEAYREIYDAQIHDEREEDSRKNDWNSEAMEELTAELERVKENHSRLIEAQDGEMQALRRQIEAYQEEIRQSGERIRSLESQLNIKEKAIRDINGENSSLTDETNRTRVEYNQLVATNAALSKKITEAEECQTEMKKSLEEKFNREQQYISTMNGLYKRIEKLESDVQETNSVKESLITSVKELQNIKESQEERLKSLSNSLQKSRDEEKSILERLSSAMREKEEAMSNREQAERRYNALLTDCNEWRAFTDRMKTELQTLKDENRALEQSEESLRARSSGFESIKAEHAAKIREMTERAERQRKRVEDLESDAMEEQRLYRARLSTAEKRSTNMQKEIEALESQLGDWRLRCQKFSANATDLEERVKATENAGRLRVEEIESELAKERQSRDRYREAYSELQNDFIHLENQTTDLQTMNRELSAKIRSLEMQIELPATENSSTSLHVQPQPLKRQASVSNADFSPIYGNHIFLGRSHSVAGNLTMFTEKQNYETDGTPAVENVGDENVVMSSSKIRRRHSSPMTPVSRSRRLRREDFGFSMNEPPEFGVISHVKEPDLISTASSSNAKADAPAAALSTLFSCEDEPNEGLEWKRIHELQKRNSKQLMHMQTSYPVETQSYDPRELASMLTKEKQYLSSSNGSLKKPLPDLSNPYNMMRQTTSSVSEELIRSGISGTSSRTNLSESNSTISSSRTAQSDRPGVNQPTDPVFKMPAALSSRPGENVKCDNDAKENVPEETTRKQSLAFEIEVSPKKVSSRSRMFGHQMKRQKYKVNEVSRPASSENQRPKSIFRFLFRRSKTKPLSARN